MRIRSGLIAAVSMSLLFAGPALAKKLKQAPPPPDPCSHTLWDIFNLRCPGVPQANGKAPPVYVEGKFVGQDPDPNVRFTIMREALTHTERN